MAIANSTTNEQANLPLEVEAIWERVQEVQKRKQVRKLEKSDVEIFVKLCKQAIEVCERAGIENPDFEVHINGDKHPGYQKRDNVESTFLTAYSARKYETGNFVKTGEIKIQASRINARIGNSFENKAKAIIVPPLSHPSRQYFVNAGLMHSLTDRFATIYPGK